VVGAVRVGTKWWIHGGISFCNHRVIQKGYRGFRAPDSTSNNLHGSIDNLTFWIGYKYTSITAEERGKAVWEKISIRFCGYRKMLIKSR
jgi:hypothetical protein